MRLLTVLLYQYGISIYGLKAYINRIYDKILLVHLYGIFKVSVYQDNQSRCTFII